MFLSSLLSSASLSVRHPSFFNQIVSLTSHLATSSCLFFLSLNKHNTKIDIISIRASSLSMLQMKWVFAFFRHRHGTHIKIQIRLQWLPEPSNPAKNRHTHYLSWTQGGLFFGFLNQSGVESIWGGKAMRWHVSRVITFMKRLLDYIKCAARELSFINQSTWKI